MVVCIGMGAFFPYIYNQNPVRSMALVLQRKPSDAVEILWPRGLLKHGCAHYMKLPIMYEIGKDKIRVMLIIKFNYQTYFTLVDEFT